MTRNVSNQPYLYKKAHAECGRIIGACNRAKIALDNDNVAQFAEQLKIIADAMRGMPEIKPAEIPLVDMSDYLPKP